MTILKKQIQIKEKPWLSLALFFLCYSALFFLFLHTLKFTFPFLMGFLLALLLQPVMRLLTQRLRIKSALASFICTAVVFLVLFGLIFLIGFALVSELSALIYRLSQADYSGFQQFITKAFADLETYLSKIDVHFIKENRSQLFSLASSGISLLSAVLGGLLSFLTSIPAVFTMIVVLMFSTYFFSKDIPYFMQAVRAQFSSDTLIKINKASSHGFSMLGKYVRSYLLIYLVTFIESFLIFWALGVKYPLVLSLVAGIADVIPILGPGCVYLPLAALYLFKGNLFVAAALLIAWGLIALIREIIEPKIVSSSIEVHPLCMLLALYVSLISGSFAMLIYLTTLFVLYQIMKKVGILSPIFPPREKNARRRDGFSKKKRK